MTGERAMTIRYQERPQRQARALTVRLVSADGLANVLLERYTRSVAAEGIRLA